MKTLLPILVAALVWAPAAGAAPAPQTPPQGTPPKNPPVENPAKPPAKPQPRATQPRGGGPTLTVEVTDKSGNGIGDVQVSTGGPVDRSGTTSADGSIVFRSMRAGTYRLRFEKEGFTTFEREVVIRAGQPASVSVALTAAPVPPPPPEPEPVPEAKPDPVPARHVEPRSLSIPDFLDANLIGGGEPQKRTGLACTDGGTAQLLQVREPLSEQSHVDQDLMLYVVAGNGVLRIRNMDAKAGPGYFALVPRGVTYGIRRDGRNPVILLTMLTGPCTDAGQ